MTAQVAADPVAELSYAEDQLGVALDQIRALRRGEGGRFEVARNALADALDAIHTAEAADQAGPL